VESERVNTADAPAPAASNPPAAGLVQCPDFVIRCMKPTGEIEDITPPLRGSRRGRAFYAKADSVGGEMRFIAIPSYTPHRFGFGGKTPLPHRLPLKGGVNFKGLCATQSRFLGLFHQPCPVGFYPAHMAGQAALAWGGGLMDAAEKMKIMAFPVNSDKFTGFFDKFPKTDERGERKEIDMNSDGYGDIVKKVVNILSKFAGLKSFSDHRISPQPPAIARTASRRRTRPPRARGQFLLH